MGFVINPYRFQAPSGSHSYGFVSSSNNDLVWTSAGTHQLDIDYPADVQADDILWLHIVEDWLFASGSVTTPDGWTLAATHGLSGEYNHILMWKRANGAESGSVAVSTTVTGSGTIRGTISAWGGCTTTSAPYESLVNNEPGSGTNVVSAEVTTSVDNEIVVNFAASSATASFTPPSGYTEAYDNTANGNALTANYLAAGMAGMVPAATTVCSASSQIGVMSLALIPA